MNPNERHARNLFDAGRWDLAQKRLEQALADEPDDYSLHALLAICLSMQDKMEAATEHGQIAVRLAPDNYYSHYALSWGYRNKKRARAAIDKCIELNPQFKHGFLRRAQLHRESRQYKALLQDCDTVLRLDALDALAHCLKAFAVWKLGDEDQAISLLEEALRLDPEIAEAYTFQGDILYAHEDYAQAETKYREALRLKPLFRLPRIGLESVDWSQHNKTTVQEQELENLLSPLIGDSAKISKDEPSAAQGAFAARMQTHWLCRLRRVFLNPFGAFVAFTWPNVVVFMLGSSMRQTCPWLVLCSAVGCLAFWLLLSLDPKTKTGALVYQKLLRLESKDLPH